MKIRFESEKTLYFQTSTGYEGALSEGSEAYMHFVTPQRDLWMQARIIALRGKTMVVRSHDGLEHTFAYRCLEDVSDKMPAVMEKEQIRQLISALQPVPHAKLPRSFEKAVRLLSRPYYDLNPQQLRHIQTLAQKNDSDILEDTRTGTQYTWGGADNSSFKLMTLAVKYKDCNDFSYRSVQKDVCE